MSSFIDTVVYVPTGFHGSAGDWFNHEVPFEPINSVHAIVLAQFQYLMDHGTEIHWRDEPHRSKITIGPLPVGIILGVRVTMSIIDAVEYQLRFG